MCARLSGGAPDVWLELRRPVTVTGLPGIRREVRWPGPGLDDPDARAARVRAETAR